MKLNLKAKTVNWLAVGGILISFLGGLMLAFDTDPGFHAFNSRIIGFDKTDYGWYLLTTRNAVDSQGRQYSFVDQGDVGFQELLTIIIDSRPEFAQNGIVKVIDTSGGLGLSIGQGQVPFKLIAVVRSGSSTADAVMFEDTLRASIDSARRSSLLSVASRLIILGFALSFLAQLVQLELKRQGSKNNQQLPINGS